MKNSVLKGVLILSVFALMSFTLSEEKGASKHIYGTWEYEALDAPYEYQEGLIVFEKVDGKTTGYASIEGYKIPLENIKVNGNKLNCETYIEGESVYFEIEFKKETFKGTASYSEGELEFTGKKVKK